MLSKRAAVTGKSPSDLLTHLRVQPVIFNAFLVLFSAEAHALHSLLFFATVSVESALFAFSMMDFSLCDLLNFGAKRQLWSSCPLILKVF